MREKQSQSPPNKWGQELSNPVRRWILAVRLILTGSESINYNQGINQTNVQKGNSLKKNSPIDSLN